MFIKFYWLVVVPNSFITRSTLENKSESSFHLGHYKRWLVCDLKSCKRHYSVFLKILSKILSQVVLLLGL